MTEILSQDFPPRDIGDHCRYNVLKVIQIRFKISQFFYKISIGKFIFEFYETPLFNEFGIKDWRVNKKNFTLNHELYFWVHKIYPGL